MPTPPRICDRLLVVGHQSPARRCYVYVNAGLLTGERPSELHGHFIWYGHALHATSAVQCGAHYACRWFRRPEGRRL